jgi:hypothetical protein
VLALALLGFIGLGMGIGLPLGFGILGFLAPIDERFCN